MTRATALEAIAVDIVAREAPKCSAQGAAVLVIVWDGNSLDFGSESRCPIEWGHILPFVLRTVWRQLQDARRAVPS